MLKTELLTLVGTLRAEVSLLTTQLAASRAPVRAPSETPRSVITRSVQRLAARYPARKSFTDAEVRREVASCSA